MIDDKILDQFTGTSYWYKFSPLTRAVLTDGTKYVAEQTNNFGLMQDVAIDCLRPKIKKALDNGLIVAEIDSEGHGIRYEDGDYNKIHSYKMTGYPPIKIRLFISLMEEGVPCIFLPSEY